MDDWTRDYLAKNGNHPGLDRGEPAQVRTPPSGRQRKVLEAAQGLDQPFGETALILASWRRWKPLFGLTGCELFHPEPRDVRNCLFGPRGLIRKGWIRKRADGLYEVMR